MPTSPISVDKPTLSLLEQRLNRGSIVTDIELKAIAILKFRQYLNSQRYSWSFQKEASELSDIGEGWQTALHVEFLGADPVLILKNSELKIDTTIPFRNDLNNTLPGNFYSYIIRASDSQELEFAVRILNAAIEEVLRRETAKAKELRRDEIVKNSQS